MAKLTDVEGLDEALAQARASAHAEGRREGYAAGRTDAAAIMAAEGAAGCPAFAAKMAADPAITPERAADLIASVPKASGQTDYRAKLAAVSPDVGPNNTPAVSDAEAAKTSRIAQLTEIGKLARR